MAIERIPAALPPTPLPSRVGAPAGLPATVGALEVAEALALALPASTALAPPESAPELAPAMRADQLVMARQLHYPPPDPSAMGSAWRLMARVLGEQQGSRREQERGQHLPGSRFMAEPAPALLREAPSPETALWCFPVYAWGRQRMLLSVLDKAPKQPPRAPARRGPAALRLDLFVPGLGHVAVQMEPFGDAVLLELATGEEEALACLRALLPQLTAAVAGAGLAIGRCRLGQRLAAGAAPAQSQFAALPLALFKAMAAVAIVLSRPQAGGGPGKTGV